MNMMGMSGGQFVTVTGLEELKRTLMQLAKEATDAEVDRGILDLGQEMVEKMKQRAHPSLRYCIVAKPFTKKVVYQSRAFVALDYKLRDVQGRIMAKLGHIFEFGTKPRYRKKAKGKGGGLAKLGQILTGTFGSTGFMPKTPFFRPVIDEYKGEKFLTRLAEIVRLRIERRR